MKEPRRDTRRCLHYLHSADSQFSTNPCGYSSNRTLHFSQAVKLIEYDSSFGEGEKHQAKLLKVTCNLNNAACKLKLKDYKEAVKLCTKVLEIESQNVKALYRRAQAYIHLVDLDLAELDIKKALEIDPDNRYNSSTLGTNILKPSLGCVVTLIWAGF